MKTIQIPTNCNPYVVVINNHVYTYKAGETAEVPDEVAEVIENHQDIHDALKTPHALIGGSTLIVEANEERTKVITPLNAIRDAWLSGRTVVLPLTQAGYTNVFTLVTGGVRSDNGDFLSALFARVSEIGIELYTIVENGALTYQLLE
jgi:hypothetical protein